MKKSRTRRYNAILMLYDIVRYTTYCDYHESRGNYGKIYDLLETVTGKGNDIVRGFGGRPHTFTGDGFICSFRAKASEAAMDAALQLHEMAKEVRKNFDGGRNPFLKVALYNGPTLFANVDRAVRPIGRAPCKASRIESMAAQNQTLASGSVVSPVIDKYDVEKLPDSPLQGIAAQRAIYSVLAKKSSEPTKG